MGEGFLGDGEDGFSLSPSSPGVVRDEEGGPVARVVVVNVGNTNVSMSVAVGTRLEAPRRVAGLDVGAVSRAVGELVEGGGGDEGEVRGVVVASVNGGVSDALLSELRDGGVGGGVPVYEVGKDIEVPVRHSLSDGAIARTGVDRLLNAVAAWDAARQAVVVVDAGTAITVDFVDGQGVFCGGAIAPGARVGLEALHRAAPALPLLEPARPDGKAFGEDTDQAMLQGVVYGAQGLVRRLVERYAEAYDAYPMVVATGGDAALLFEEDELVDRVVPHLTLRGVAVACRAALSGGGDEG